MGFLKRVSEVKAAKDWKSHEWRVRLALYDEDAGKNAKLKASFEKALAALINKFNDRKTTTAEPVSSFPVLHDVMNHQK